MLEKQVRVLVFAFKLGWVEGWKEGDYQGCQKTATIVHAGDGGTVRPWQGRESGRGHRRDGRKAR